jgi:hypothetical protein
VPGQPIVDHLAIELTLGQHTLRVRALDESGFFDPTPASYTWTIVPTPDTFITAGPTDNTRETSASFSFVSDVAGATFQCALDGGSFEACTSPVELTDLSVGWHQLAVRAVDAAGHVDPGPALHGWNIQHAAETEPPDTMITMAPEPPPESPGSPEAPEPSISPPLVPSVPPVDLSSLVVNSPVSST